MTLPRGDRLLTPLMLGVASGSILVPLNSTMLAVALPGVMDEFHLGAGPVASLVTLYLGTVAVALPASGSLGDRFGHRRLFLAGVLVFAIASAIAAGAGSFGILQLARVLQAISGAFVSTSSASLIREAAPAARRGEAFGLFDLLVSTSAAAGPFIGGILVGAFGWRSLFYVAVPVALIALAAVGLGLRPAESTAADAEAGPADAVTAARAAPARLDLIGLALLGAIIGAFLIAIRGGDGPLPLVSALAILPLGYLFVRFELRTAYPAVDPRLFAQRPFAAAVVGVFGATVVLHACFVLIPFLVERVLAGSAETSGLVLLGISGIGALIAPFGGRASDRRGRRQLVVAGSLVMAGGLAGLATPVGGASFLAVGVLLGVVGLGLGLSGSPRQAAAFESVPGGRIGMAAGTYYTGRYLGGVVGASLAGAVLATTVSAGAVSFGFAVLVVVAVAMAIASLGLPGLPTARPVVEGSPGQDVAA